MFWSIWRKGIDKGSPRVGVWEWEMEENKYQNIFSFPLFIYTIMSYVNNTNFISSFFYFYFFSFPFPLPPPRIKPTEQCWTLQDIWSCPKHPQTHLVHTKSSFKSCLIQNVHEDMWSVPKGPWNLVLSKMSTPRKHSCIQTMRNIYLYFLFTGLIHKKYYHWSSNCVVAYCQS